MSDNKKWFKQKVVVITIHCLVWVLILYFPYLLNWEFSDNRIPVFRFQKFINDLLMVCLFYFNSYYLIPNLYNKKNVFIYALFVLITTAFIILITVYINYIFPHHFYLPSQHASFLINKQNHYSHGNRYVREFVSCIVFLTVSFSYRIIIDNIKKEKEQKAKENENIKTELSFLRSQVSPHFMFNTLNSIVALTRKKSDKVEAALIELSDLMRYMLYESDETKVNLEKEVEYIKNYINLQMLRFGDDLKMDVQLPECMPDISIEPMLLIPLVENAFKHGVGTSNAEINIQLNAVDSEITLKVSNNFSENNGWKKGNNSGIGLNNLKRRLDLLYPKKYHLNTFEIDDIFIAKLKIVLQ